jgi:hypothetical protein
MVEVIEIIFREDGKAAEQSLPVSSDMKLIDFREAAQTLLSLPENLPCELVLERTREVLRNELNFADAEINDGDKLILVPLSLRDFTPEKGSSSSSERFSKVQAETFSAAKSPSLVTYTLQLIVMSNDQPSATYEYPIKLAEFYEDNPQRFFNDSNARERQNFVTALQEIVPREVQIFEIDKILRDWCEDISLGYRNTPITIET